MKVVGKAHSKYPWEANGVARIFKCECYSQQL